VRSNRTVRYGAPAATELLWTPEAQARLNRIPSFVRGVVAERIENFARARGISTITAELMSDIRQQMPVDFSKRLPFFAQGRTEV